MTVVRINAITVPKDSGDELAHRFAARAGAVDDADGFEGFELLRPTDERTQWLVATRWRDEAAFQAWVSSPAFAQGHQSERGPEDGPPDSTAGNPAGNATDRPAPHTERSSPDGSADSQAPRPVATHSELWSFDIAGGSTPQA